MQIMKHLITTVGEPKMKRGGVGGREGWRRVDKEDRETTRRREEEGRTEAEEKVRGQEAVEG